MTRTTDGLSPVAHRGVSGSHDFMESHVPSPDDNVPPMERSHWVAFAGILLLTSALFNLLNGFVAIFNHGYYSTVYAQGNRLLIFNYTAWGWIWVAVGIVMALAGIGVLVGSRGARRTGICLAVLCLVGQMIFLPVYPFWSLLTMLLSVLVIYGLLAEPRHVSGVRL
ncbi:hypothetical protein ACGFSG_37165 [Streptomyces sp. NPDC048512]|uniref:DUF7144 family membrane protein n=1 Tax=Streptomyces sp. NPDC048512 TaxID=3365563 RepID=UPI003720F624